MSNMRCYDSKLSLDDIFPSGISVKSLVLSRFLSLESIILCGVGIVSPGDGVYSKISSLTGYSRNQVKSIINTFLGNLVHFSAFLHKKGCIKWTSDLKRLNRKVRIYIRKLHRLAPVFNYGRARANLVILHKMLSAVNFWPTITTQLALILYFTDKNSEKSKKLIQKNIRAMCSCSSFSFHQARNKLDEIFI